MSAGEIFGWGLIALVMIILIKVAFFSKRRPHKLLRYQTRKSSDGSWDRDWFDFGGDGGGSDGGGDGGGGGD